MRRVKRIISCLLLALIISGCFAATGNASAEELLTMDRAIQISDYEVVIEFSAPIAINLKQNSVGPYTSIRYVGENSTIAWTGEAGTSSPLQWSGSLEFVDSKHDRILFTLRDMIYGVQSINDIMNYSGELAKYRGVYNIMFSMEEVPYDRQSPFQDGTLDNITTIDGEMNLLATRPKGYDGAYCKIEKDYDYPIERALCTGAGDLTRDTVVTMALGTANAQAAENMRTVIKNDPLRIALILGIGAVVAVGSALLVGVLVRKAGKKA